MSFLKRRLSRSDGNKVAVGPLARTRIELVVNEIEQEEQDCRQLLEDLDDGLPYFGERVRFWALLPLHMATILRHYSAQLKRHRGDGGDTATEQLFRAMESGRSGETAAVSGWLEQTWAPGLNPRNRRSSIARSDPVNLASVEEMEERTSSLPRSKTIAGFAAEWRIGEWDFDALKCELDHRHVLQKVGFEFLRRHSVLPRAQLGRFLERLERSYDSGNPYHSHVHAADMANALFFLLTKTDLWQLADFADSTRAATIVAALGHDVGHFGRNNLFLISSRHSLAITYNDRSVLENFHSATLIRLLDEEYGDGLEDRKRLFSGFSADHLQKAHSLIISLVLSTDPAKHLDDLSSLRIRMGASSFDPISDDSDQQQCLCMLFRAADISHSAKEWSLHEEWSRRVVREFHAQGDEEKRLGLKVSPLCDRENFEFAKSQVGFLTFICLPTWTELANLESRVKDVGQFLPRIRGSRKSTMSSGGSRATPRSRSTSRHFTGGSGATPRGSEHRASLGHTLQMLTSSAKTTQFLLLPGALPSGSPSAKVAPADAQRIPEDSGPPPARLIRDVCLAHCDSNCKVWKGLGPAMTAESLASPKSARTASGSEPPEGGDVKAPRAEAEDEF